MTADKTKQPRNLTEKVLDGLSAKIRNGEFIVGQKMPPESELMGMFGVSRTVVREAISRLQASGLVETRHGVGTFLLEPEGKSRLQIKTTNIFTMLDVMEILELRIALETEAAGLAAVRRTDEHVHKLRQILDDFASNLNGENNSVSSDIDFHLLVASATGNHYFYDILKQFGQAIIPRTRLNLAPILEEKNASYLQRVHVEHENILNSILRKDVEAAKAAMRTHLTNSRERLRKAQDEAAKLAKN